MNPENIYPRTNDHGTVYLKNIIEKLPQSERRLLILRFVLELNDREIGRKMHCSRSAIQRRRTSILRNMRKQLAGELP